MLEAIRSSSAGLEVLETTEVEAAAGAEYDGTGIYTDAIDAIVRYLDGILPVASAFDQRFQCFA